jgi:hypothetical protein
MLEDAPNLLDFAPETPPSMAAAVMKSLNKELDDRFSSMEEFRKGLLGEILVAGAASHKAPGMGKRPAAPTGVRPNVVTTMSPQAQSTTLSSASSEIDDELAAPKKKTGLVVGGGVALVAAAGIAFFVMGGKPADAPKAPVVAAAPAPSAPVAPPAPPAKTTVTVRFEASPAGSHLFRKSDNKDLGAAPVDVKLPHNGPATDYVLRKDGYKDYGVTADLSEDNTVHVALEKVEAPQPVAQKPEPEKKKVSGGGRKGGGKRKGPGVPDEDGLATPSF